MEIQSGGDSGTLTAANNMTGVLRVQKELGYVDVYGTDASFMY
jgi:hypothetical protein